MSFALNKLRFLIFTIIMFEKLPFTIQEQIERLQERGLIISPEDNANHYLSHISYYRLGEYWHSMQLDKVKHIFKENSKLSGGS